MEWTEQRIETLRKLWGQGQTASQIAAILGGITRNAVIGKAHRLGLTGRPSPIKREAGSAQPRRKAAAGRQERPVRNAPPLTTTAASQAVNNLSSPTSATVAAPAQPAASASAHAGPQNAPAARSSAGAAVGSMAMPAMSGGTASAPRTHAGSKSCSWPVGDPKQPGFHFCGEPAEPGRPYCANHCHVAYHRKSEAA
jgi:GcrA cell cycle regulator